MENTKFCPHCGTKLGAEVKFCPKCGFNLMATTAKANTKTETVKPASTPKQPVSRSTASTPSFNDRLDQMVKWVTNNWATTIILVIGVFAVSLVMRVIFYHAALGLIALVAVLIWLYSYAWTNGVEPTSVEQQLRHITKQSVSAVKSTQQAHVEKAQAKSAQADTQATSASQDTTNMGQPNATGNNNIYVQTTSTQSNGLGTAGFVLALLSIVVSWVPVVDFIVWFLGALFSFIGLFKQPRGLAIAGFILSFIGIIVILILITTIGGLGLGLLSSM